MLQKVTRCNVQRLICCLGLPPGGHGWMWPDSLSGPAGIFSSVRVGALRCSACCTGTESRSVSGSAEKSVDRPGPRALSSIIAQCGMYAVAGNNHVVAPGVFRCRQWRGTGSGGRRGRIVALCNRFRGERKPIVGGSCTAFLVIYQNYLVK